MPTMALARGQTRASSLLDKLMRRNLIGTTYPDSDEYHDKVRHILKQPSTVYAGFDVTSDSLHIGNLAVLMNLIHFHLNGHRVILLIGDATTQIGDPSGHSSDRAIIEKQLIDHNANSIEKNIRKLFSNLKDFFPKPKCIVTNPIFVRNSEWYKKQNPIDFVGNVFREVRVSGLLHRKGIQERLASKEGVNMSEFCYQIFQAYDWYHLRKNFSCQLQVGGSDQAGNIYTGHDFIKRYSDCKDSVGLLTPLIVNATGKKIGKSTTDPDSNVWLDQAKTSPYNFYQSFVRTPDADVERYLKVYSLYEEEDIENLIQNNLKKKNDVWFCQRKLANHSCLLVHGNDSLITAKKISQAFFQKSVTDFAKLTDAELDQLFDKESIINAIYLNNIKVIDLVRKAGSFKSDLEAVKVIEAGGLRLNNQLVTSANVSITDDLVLPNNTTIMKIGKRNYYLFKWQK